MQEIIKLYEWFDDYTKKLVGQLYYEENLKNGKTTEEIRKMRADSNTVKA
jgi:hypothetical protein